LEQGRKLNDGKIASRGGGGRKQRFMLDNPSTIVDLNFGKEKKRKTGAVGKDNESVGWGFKRRSSWVRSGMRI